MTSNAHGQRPKMIQKLLLFLLVGMLTNSIFANGQRASLGLSSGYAWSSRNQALLVNPAALASGDSRLSLYGLYGVDTENFTGTFTAMSGAVGFGAGAVYDGDATNTYLAGVAFNMSAVSIGAAMNKAGSDDPTFNVGATIDLSSLRLAAVFENVQNVTQADFALGLMSGPVRFEVGILEEWPLSTKNGTLYTGFVYNAHPLSISLGAYQTYADASFTGAVKFRAGLEIALLRNIAVDAEYNSFIDDSEYSAGLRVKF